MCSSNSTVVNRSSVPQSDWPRGDTESGRFRRPSGQRQMGSDGDPAPRQSNVGRTQGIDDISIGRGE